MLATVFIVDDDASFLRGISRLFQATGYNIQAYSSAEEFLSQLAPEMSGCVVADLQMPGVNGLQLQELLREADNPLPIIFLTGQGNIPASVRAMRAGAEDFLTKSASKESLLAAVERAMARDAAERKRRQRLRELRARFAALSPREQEVLGHVVQGKLNKQIAADLGINERTVKLHRTSITTKLRVHSVAELTRLTAEAGLFVGDAPPG